MTLDVVLVGFGNVARRALRLLDEIGPHLPFETRVVAIVTARHGAAWSETGLDPRAAATRVESGGVLDGWPSSLPPPAPAGGSNARVISALAERHGSAAHQGRLVCIETTVLDVREGEPATSHVRAALEGRAHVVTANKGPAAFAYQDLAAIAQARSRQFLFEGAVMDGIPVFNLVRDTLPGVIIQGFRGVINSTTNHILTMLGQGVAFDAALAQMQAEGIAEADPTLDVDGWDAAAKTAALINVWMGARVTPRDIEREGIRGVSIEDVRAASARGERLRLVASAEQRASQVDGRVRIERLPANDPLAGLEGQQNGILIRTNVLGEIGILQRDGGLTQTAYALITDLSAIARARP